MLRPQVSSGFERLPDVLTADALHEALGKIRNYLHERGWVEGKDAHLVENSRVLAGLRGNAQHVDTLESPRRGVGFQNA